MTKKWNPGHYMQVPRGDHETVQANRFVYYDQIATNTDLVGVFVPFRWSMLEGAQGDYSAGIATIQAEIVKLKNLTVPKRFYLRIIDYHYGAVATNSAYFPTYVQSGGTYVGTNGVGWCRWSTSWMDAYIDMIEAYAAAFDSEPYFEGIYLYRETAPAVGTTTPCGYTLANYQTQTERMLTAAGAAWPQTNVILSANYIGSQTVMDDIIAHGATVQTGVGGPDVESANCDHRTAARRVVAHPHPEVRRRAVAQRDPVVGGVWRTQQGRVRIRRKGPRRVPPHAQDCQEVGEIERRRRHQRPPTYWSSSAHERPCSSPSTRRTSSGRNGSGAWMLVEFPALFIHSFRPSVAMALTWLLVAT